MRADVGVKGIFDIGQFSESGERICRVCVPCDPPTIGDRKAQQTSGHSQRELRTATIFLFNPPARPSHSAVSTFLLVKRGSGGGSPRVSNAFPAQQLPARVPPRPMPNHAPHNPVSCSENKPAPSRNPNKQATWKSAKKAWRSFKSTCESAKEPWRSPKSTRRSAKSPWKSAKEAWKSAKPPWRIGKEGCESAKEAWRSGKESGRLKGTSRAAPISVL